jgi:hypothetical protein
MASAGLVPISSRSGRSEAPERPVPPKSSLRMRGNLQPQVGGLRFSPNQPGAYDQQDVPR